MEMTTVITEILGLMTSLVTIMTEKPLAYWFWGSLASVAIGIFMSLKRAARK